MNKDILVIKRNGTHEYYTSKKIVSAIKKSANRIKYNFNKSEIKDIIFMVEKQISNEQVVSVNDLHSYVEQALDVVCPRVAKSYKDYRNYKKEFVYSTIENIERKVHSMLTDVDRSNSNSNTRYISTKRTEVAKLFSSEMYQKMFLSVDVIQAIKDGYIYIHDLADMLLPQFNCCLCDYKTILRGGFELEGIKYTEPKDIRTAVGQMGDILQIISAQHFGGHTVPEIDKVLAKYYKMSIEKETDYTMNIINSLHDCDYPLDIKNINSIKEKSKNRAYREMKQALQGFEIKMNTVVSARGSYPFSTLTFGDVSNDAEAAVAKAILEVRMEGHGDVGFKKNLIFPKLVFLYNPEIHGKGKEYEWLYDLAIKCSSKCMYPDFLSPSHKKEGKWISPIEY